VSFLVAPGGNLDRAFERGIGIEHAGRFERVDDPERAVEPAGVVLAFEVRSREQLGSRLCAGAKDIADAVDRGGEACVGQLLHQPIQRKLVRLGEGRLVHAGLVRANGTERIEIGENALAVCA
jgi:hypothetical protein